jgi:alpha-L-fucosidase 2
VTGLRARSGFEVDIAWADGHLTRAVLRSKLGRNCRVRSARPLRVAGVEARPAEEDVIEFSTDAGAEYALTPADEEA